METNEDKPIATELQQPLTNQPSLAQLFAKLRIFNRERGRVARALLAKPWFLATSFKVQLELLTLPENFQGYLDDLALRPDIIGDLEIVQLEQLSAGKRTVISVFKVRKPDGTEFSYEYTSWDRGSFTGSKGIIFFGDENELSHFVVLRCEKFGTGLLQYDCVGGFTEKVNGKWLNPEETFAKELKEELDIPEVRFARPVIDLGKLHVDAGLTNCSPHLFFCVLDKKTIDEIPKQPNNPDLSEVPLTPSIFPIERLSEIILSNNDSFFLSAVARACAAGLLSMKQ